MKQHCTSSGYLSRVHTWCLWIPRRSRSNRDSEGCGHFHIIWDRKEQKIYTYCNVNDWRVGFPSLYIMKWRYVMMSSCHTYTNHFLSFFFFRKSYNHFPHYKKYIQTHLNRFIFLFLWISRDQNSYSEIWSIKNSSKCSASHTSPIHFTILTYIAREHIHITPL